MRRKNFLSDINVTPFVDVMLVLLIIFMIAAPMLQKGVEVKLPRVKEAPVLKLKEEPLVITVKKTGQVYINNHSYPLKVFSQKIKALHKEIPYRKVIVRADARVFYETVLKVMAAIREAGYEQIGLVVKPLKGK